MASNCLIFLGEARGGISNEEEAQAGADALNGYFSTVDPPRFTVISHPTLSDLWAVGDHLLTEEQMIAAVEQENFAAALNAYGATRFRCIGPAASLPLPLLEETGDSWGSI